MAILDDALSYATNSVLPYVVPRVLPTLAIGLVCIVLQRISPSIRGQRTWTTDSWLNSHYAIAATFLFPYLNVAAIYLVLIAAERLFDVSAGEAAAIAAVPVWVRILLALVCFDFIAYWIHRGFHRSKLWRIHAIHHSSRELDWLSSTRFHPLDRMLVMTAQVTVTVLVLGFSLEVAAAAGVIRSTYGLFAHSNLDWTFGRLGYLLASPTFHRWHHTQQELGREQNYAGVFSAFDHLFGTAYRTKDERPEHFGIEEFIGEGLATQLVSPFVSRVRLGRWADRRQERRRLARAAMERHAQASPETTLGSGTGKRAMASLPSVK